MVNIMINKSKAIKKLYKDALYYHLIDIGNSEFEAELLSNRYYRFLI